MKLTGAESSIAHRVEKVWEEAKASYQITDNSFTLIFLNNARMNATSAKYSQLTVRENHTPAGFVLLDRQDQSIRMYMNRRAIRQDYTHMLNEVVPHEIAHAVCLLRPQYGDGHDDGWAEVCVRLGGTGKVTYDTEFDLRRDRRVRREFIYNVGQRRVRLSETWHDRIQGGKDYVNQKSNIRISRGDYTGVWV